MPQPGIHAILALSCRNRFSSRPWFALGLVLGSMLPDVDGYVSAAAVLIMKMDPSAAETAYHRTWTHSLFFAIAIVLLCAFISPIRGGKALRTFGAALATGMIIFHIIPDIFIWFDRVGVLWPYDSIDLWQNHQHSVYEHNVLQAGNFLAFSAYFAYLIQLSKRSELNCEYVHRLKVYGWLQFCLGAAFLALAFWLPEPKFTRLTGAFFLLFAFPNALWITWRMRSAIEE